MCAVAQARCDTKGKSILDGTFANSDGDDRKPSEEEYGTPLPSDTPLHAIENLVAINFEVRTYRLTFFICHLEQLYFKGDAQIRLGCRPIKIPPSMGSLELRSQDDVPLGSVRWIGKYQVMRSLWWVQLFLEYDFCPESFYDRPRSSKKRLHKQHPEKLASSAVEVDQDLGKEGDAVSDGLSERHENPVPQRRYIRA